jgi:hypothetical protein
METYLNKNNICYKIIPVTNTCKFKINNVQFHYSCGGIKNYHCLVVYVPITVFELMFTLLQNKIKLVGVIDSMNIYKYELNTRNIEDVLNVVHMFRNKKLNHVMT